MTADPNAVTAFVAVVHHRSFRQAALAIGVPRSTLSQRVANLEAQVGARLLARTTRSVSLTDIGASYYREVAPALEALVAAEDTIGQLKARPSGRIRLTAPFELGQFILGEALAAYTARYPEVKVEVDLSDRQVNLIEESYDLAVRIGPLHDSTLVARRLGRPQHLGVYASCDYLRRYGTPKEPRDLRQHRCLAMSGAQTWTKWAFRQSRRTELVELQPTVAVNSFAVLKDLVVAGAGISRIPCRYADSLVRDKQIREILRRYALPPRETFVLTPSGRHISPAVRAMIDVLLESPGFEPASR